MPGIAVFEFGRVDGGKNKNLSIADSDGDVVTFKLSGGGTGKLLGQPGGIDQYHRQQRAEHQRETREERRWAV